MKLADFLIIGGGIAGTTAAETLRELDPHATISIIDAEPHPLYSRVMIPGYLKHKTKRDALFLRKISDYSAKKIGLYSSRIVSRIDYQKREVYTDAGPPRLALGEAGEVFPYKKLLIASGGLPKPWFLPGLAAEEFLGNILRMHTLDDADNILSKMKSHAASVSEDAPQAGGQALVVGEGFIALEFIESFLKNGFSVHAIFKENYFNEKRFGVNGGKIMQDAFSRNGVIMHRRTEPATINGMEITFKNGERLSPELIGAGVGIMRNLDSFGGIKKNIGILTNDFLEASEENVYSAGDIAEYFDAYSGVERAVGNWTNSFLQGRAVALNMFASLAGKEEGRAPYAVVPAYNIINLKLNITFVGYLEDADDFWEKLYDGGITRVFLKAGKVRGAVLINRFGDKIKIAELIKSNADIHELAKAFS